MQQQIWGDVVDFNLAFFQFIWECNSENIIKIGPYLPKLLQEKFGAVFLAHPVYHSTQGSSATRSRCGGCLTAVLLQIVRGVCQWENSENRSILSKNMDKQTFVGRPTCRSTDPWYASPSNHTPSNRPYKVCFTRHSCTGRYCWGAY